MTPVVQHAQPDDFEAIARLLGDQDLPLDGLREHLATTIVARDPDLGAV